MSCWAFGLHLLTRLNAIGVGTFRGGRIRKLFRKSNFKRSTGKAEISGTKGVTCALGEYCSSSLIQPDRAGCLEESLDEIVGIVAGLLARLHRLH
jgi:hypothetical protein